MIRLCRSILEAQLRQKAPELLLQRVDRNTPACEVVGTINRHGAKELPPLGCGFAFCHELLLDLSQPTLQESLCLSIMCLLCIQELPCHLLTERHAEE